MNSVLLVSIILFSAYAVAADCEDGWVPYKDELCIKAFPNILAYTEAKDFCFSQGNDISKGSLVMIKEPELQQLLVNYTHDMYNILWLGGRYDEESSQFKWDDGEPLTYTNWQEGYPRNSTDRRCIELRPINSKLGVNTDGKWADANCQKQIQVICQRELSWTLQDAINEIIKTRKQLEATNEVLQTTTEILQTTIDNLQTTKENLHETQTNLEIVSSRVVPVGSIYIEYFNQPKPGLLWPTLSWEDISRTYDSLFFRAYGSSSGKWGEIQDECSPGISQVDYWFSSSMDYATLINMPSSGWSSQIKTGYHDNGMIYQDRLRFNITGCEVRPKNQAIRVWKRTA